MRKTSLSFLVLSLAFSLALTSIVKAQYGPPVGAAPGFDPSQIPAGFDPSQIPAGFDPSQIPGGMPGNMPGGAPVNMGPSPEQLEKMQQGEAKAAEMEKKGAEMQKAGETKALEQIKTKAIPQFEKAVANFKKQVKKLNDKGAPTTEMMKIELEKLDKFIADIKAATDIETLTGLFDQFADLADSAQEALQNMSKGAKWPSVEKQANKLIKDLEKQYITLEAKTKRKGINDELATTFSEFKTAIEKQKATLETLKAQVKVDPDEVFDTIGDYFESFKDIYENYVREINSSLDLKTAIKTQLPKFINSLELKVKALSKNKKLDLTKLKAMIVEAKAKLAEIKKLSAGKIADNMDEIIDAMDALTDIGPAFDDEFERLTGKLQNNYMPKLPPDKPADYKVNMPPGIDDYTK